MNLFKKLAVIIVVVLFPLAAHSVPVPPPTGIVGSYTNSGGSYDADTLALFMLWQGPGIRVGTLDDWNAGGGLDVNASSMSVNASVDNEGNLLGGVFDWFGAIPDLGITSVSSLASGKVTGIDVLYSYSPDSVGEMYVHVEFTSFASELINSGLEDLGLGPFGIVSLTALAAWAEGVTPWSVSDTFPSPTLNELLTYQTRPRQAVSEPGTLGLLGIGLAAIGLARRQKLI